MENRFIIFPVILSHIIEVLAHYDRSLIPNYQISLNEFRKNCSQAGMLTEIAKIQGNYANLLAEISQSLLITVHYQEKDADTINTALQKLCNKNETLHNLLYSAADIMLRCLDSDKNVHKSNIEQVMLDNVCTEQKFRYYHNRNFYHDPNRGCIWDMARNISECYKEQCARRLWRIEENCECVNAECTLCYETCYDPFYNNILFHAPINFSSEECDDLYRRVSCELDLIKHCEKSDLKRSFESIYTLRRSHHCRSRIPNWR